MFIKNLKNIIGLVALFSIIGLALAFNPSVRADDEIQPPELPASCGSLQVPAGNEAFFRVYATGVQVYRWNGTSWGFVGPVANLYANANYRGKVGTHYATPNGPAWESNSGSMVVAGAVANCNPDPTAIRWLRLQTVTADGPGIFSKVTFIQRVNTAGGLAPAEPGYPNEERRVPYTTEYYFYKEAE